MECDAPESLTSYSKKTNLCITQFFYMLAGQRYDFITLVDRTKI